MADLNQTPQGSDDIRKRIAWALIQSGMDTSPIKHWTQGAARLAQAFAGNYGLNQIEENDKAATSQLVNALMNPAGNATQDYPPMGGQASASAQSAVAGTPPVAPGGGSTVVPPTMQVAGGGGEIPLPPPRPVFNRSSLVDEANDPAMAQRLATIVQGEVGRNATPEQKMVQAETMFNRAAARGQSLNDVTQMYTGPGSKGYYPRSTFLNGGASPAEAADFQKNILTPVLRGSDVSSQSLGFPATGNASGSVAANGIANGRYSQSGMVGPETYVQQPGGREDIARLEATRLAQGGPPQPNQGPVMAAPQRAEPTIPPNIAAAIQAGLASGSPTARALALSMMQKYAQPQEYGFQTLPDGTMVRTNKSTGAVDPVFGFNKPQLATIGKDQDGTEIKGWINPTTKEVWNLQGQLISGPQAGSNAPSNKAQFGQAQPYQQVPGLPSAANPAAAAGGGLGEPPPGVNPQQYRKSGAEFQAKLDVQNAQTSKNSKINAGFVSGLVNEAIKIIDDNPHTAAGPVGQFTKGIEAAPAGHLASTLEGIRARIAFEELNKMRAASPTGGALGSVTEGEEKLLASVYGSITPGLAPDVLKARLRRLDRVYNAVINEGPQAAANAFAEDAKSSAGSGGWGIKRISN